jgi:hypothetical protein
VLKRYNDALRDCLVSVGRSVGLDVPPPTLDATVSFLVATGVDVAADRQIEVRAAGAPYCFSITTSRCVAHAG